MITRAVLIFSDFGNLKPGEIISLIYYSHRGDQINNYFRTGIKFVEEQYKFTAKHVKIYSKFLDGAFQKLPRYEIPDGEVLYRGASDYETKLITGLKEGEIYNPSFYYSTSKNQDIAIGMVSHGSPGDLIIRITGNDIKGIDISSFSRYNEREVLFSVDSKFEKSFIIPREYSSNGVYPEVTLIPKL